MIPKREYSTLSLRFMNYIETTKQKRIKIDALNKNDEMLYMTMPYVHRWTEQYHNRILHKMYCLEKWYKENKPETTMITFTSKQKNKNIRTVWEKIKKGFRKTLDIIRIIFKEEGISYFWVTEPHKSGYPHIHLCLFTKITKEQKERIKEHWTKKQKIGSIKHGISFQEGNSIKSIKNYLLKYMTKSCNYSNITKLNKGQKYFNMIAWDNNIRLIGFSRDISKTFTKQKEKMEAIKIEIQNEAHGTSTVIYNKNSELVKISQGGSGASAPLAARSAAQYDTPPPSGRSDASSGPHWAGR